ncbi:MAG: hypothetical protein AAB776_03430, partial [Patescibacteria group bacterium]
MSTKTLLALAALTLAACSGPTGDGSNNGDGLDSSTDSGGTVIEPGTGQITIHAVYDGNAIVSQVVDMDGNVLGPTDEIIP